mmetsp:Transcript_14532/g.38882  ORF Transcript_14532/g.38882 Transcript_14532/m.38882 type:complete len:82 (-) Transcript_14532:235-480(-)|eukprot:CAMPEP_0185833490 /NCGR_PEP_ID=MMETSP1353-20130828/3001_1 /TAXON_ID=1077150 /ORGANISM="Erythrolobus australicus, Strain CCMP3124" /LENGTH=81 /DNA_ID=CAMNT_0028531789 /DNA_START=141 /DNA_END=386 /DNA_ORIENTATION=-
MGRMDRLYRRVMRPTLNKVHIVFSNGATLTTYLPWMAPSYKTVVWRFFDLDWFNNPAVTGKASGLKAIGARAKFEKKFGSV